MVIRFIALVMMCFMCFGCGTTVAQSVRPFVAEERRPEMQALPENPATEELPLGTPTDPPEDFVVPIEVGECDSIEETCPPLSGILISESRANRNALYRIRYRELRQTVEADRQVWMAQRALYEAQLSADREEIERLQPSWWERHDGEILAVIGVIAGAALTVALTFAVNEASE